MRRVDVMDRAAPELHPHDHVAWADKGSAGFARLVHQVVATAPDDVQLIVIAAGDEAEWNPSGLFDEDLASGRLNALDANAMYATVLSDDIDIHDTLAAFDRELAGVLEQGRSGMRVIADNTAMLTGSDANFERWVAWEQLTDGWQATRPVTGICYFDTAAVDPERLASISSIHPLSSGHGARGYTLFHDPVAGSSPSTRLAVAGAVDVWDVDELVSRATSQLDADPGLDRVLDLSRAEYVHHRLLLALRRHEVLTVGATGLVAQQQRVVDLLG